MASRSYGYARVSTSDQNLDRQLDAFAKLDLDAVFEDSASGKDFDRLGRNYDEILDVWRELTRDKQVDIVVLDMPLLDTRNRTDGVTGSLISDIVLQLLAYVAQVEREKIRERQAQGIAAAKARGKRFGRPPIQKPDTFEQVKGDFESRRITRKEAASLLGVSPSTFDAWRKN